MFFLSRNEADEGETWACRPVSFRHAVAGESGISDVDLIAMIHGNGLRLVLTERENAVNLT